MGSWWLGVPALVTAVLVLEQAAFGRSLIDVPVRIAIDSTRCAWLDAAMCKLTWLGRGEVLGAIVIGCAALASRRGERSTVRFLITAGAGSAVLTFTLKLLVARDRPDLLERMVPADGYSFPSGHSLSSAAVYGAVASWLRARGGTWWRSLITAGAAFIVIAVGVSRVYLQVHYPSDVLAGWSMGILWVAVLQPSMRLRPQKTRCASHPAHEAHRGQERSVRWYVSTGPQAQRCVRGGSRGVRPGRRA